MKTQRNVEGLRQNAQRKRQESFDKVDRGIKEMIRTKQKINFKTVAAVCGVSKAFLYKESEIKGRIEHLRQQSTEAACIAPEQRPSESSKDALIKTLRERLKVLSEKVKELEHQNATVYGKIVQMTEIEAENRRLKTQNESLKQQIVNVELTQPTQDTVPDLKFVESTGKVSSITDKRAILDQISQDLDSLGIKVNSTLAKVIRSASESVVLNAIAALKEAIASDRIERPGAWLKTAIENQWISNEALEKIPKTVSNSPHTFREWYDLAKAYGKITAFEDCDGVMMVRENAGGWYTYLEYVAKGWTIEYFRGWKSRRI
jgi:small-conductance mechanosensitive channel